MAALLVAASVASAQEGADVTLLRSIYAWDAPAVTLPLRVADKTAYPAFVLVPVAVYAADGEWRPAGRIVASEAAAALLAGIAKRVVRRPRPYTRHPDVALRSHHLDRRVLEQDTFGFPSGHTTLAFAAATSVSLSHPRWYVIVPAQTWAATMGVSRVWHGAHYPSDVLAGAALGIVVAGAVHVLLPDDNAHRLTAPAVTLRLVF